MSVSLTPSSSLGFHRPLTQLAKRSLAITNNNAQPIAFKVKTTAPKLYCVRPNSGRVEPGQTVEVSVMLQAMKEEPPQNAKCKDKFLIQSTLITREKETLPLQDIWATPEGGDETTKVYQQKLRVTYLPPEGQPLPEEVEPQVVAEPEAVNGHGLHHPTSSTETQGNGVPEEPIQQPSKQEPQRSNTPHNEYKFAPEESHEHEESTRDIPIEDLPPQLQTSSASNPLDDQVPEHQESGSEPEPAPLPIPPVSSRHPPAPDSLEQEDIESHPLFQELLSEYNAALAELQKLRRELDESSRYEGTKSRPYASSVASDVDDNVYQQDGVPLQIVVIIALAVFITTYLFL